MHLNRLGGIIAATFALGAAACRHSTAPSEVIKAEGTVQLSVEGCYRILTQSHAYQPRQMPAAFAVDGMRVYFEAKLKPTFNTCMAGDVVELLRIEHR